MDLTVSIIFAATYIGMALGRLPGLRIDRTGIALLALVALLASDAVPLAAMGRAVDMPTLLLLFALMIVSSQFQAAGFYRAAAAAITTARGSGARLLALTIAIAGLLSAVLANDIIAFAMAPIIAEGTRRRGLDPRPYLIGLAGASNAGSAATVIGNPQNILIGQAWELDFWHFLLACGPPALASLIIVYAAVWAIWRKKLVLPIPPDEPIPAPDRWQTGKGVVAILALLALFATDLPRELGALLIAGFLLVSRKLASRDMIGAVDWHLLLLFACLFIITDAFAAGRHAAEAVAFLAGLGFAPGELSVMAPLMLGLSNTIGNVPAVMLLLSIWPDETVGPLYGLALLSTLAGNLLIVGSLANIIVVERAASVGVKLGFLDHAKCGIPMTLASMAVAALWLAMTGLMN
jgi:Na+/H+ antiporter NhaD/arsenite permease-like protein